MADEYLTALRKADSAFSKYIRTRDTDDNGNGRCVSCGKPITYKTCNAGHYLSRRYMATRFDEMNVNAQCVYCNKYLSGNVPMYRQKLVKIYGNEAVEKLELKSQMSAGYKTHDLLFIADEYKQKLKDAGAQNRKSGS